jgi:hypothetical protein
MATPRLMSRSDRSPSGWTRSRAAHELADYTDPREFFSAPHRDSQLIDPGRLVEAVFLGTQPEEDAEAVLIAWLTVLPKSADAPSAATHLAHHLNQLLSGEPSILQRRLLDLLAYVAAHKRGALTTDLKQEVKP